MRSDDLFAALEEGGEETLWGDEVVVEAAAMGDEFADLESERGACDRIAAPR